MKLKARDEFAVELEEANKTGNVYQGWCRPALQELVFGHGRVVSIWEDTDSNKLESRREKVALFQTQSETISLRNAELTLNIL
jgi:hypothetical protein